MSQFGKLALACAGSVLTISGAAAQVCDTAQRESGPYLVLNAGEKDNGKAKCVVGGTRCETQFAVKDTSYFTLVMIAAAPDSAGPSRRTDGTPHWKVELYASNPIDKARDFDLVTDNPKETQHFAANQIDIIDAKKYRVTLEDKMEAALEKANNVNWIFKEQGKQQATTLTFSLSGSERTLKWIKCIQARPQYLTSCETTTVKADWISRHRAVSDANEVLGALNSQIAIYPADDFGHDQKTRKDLQNEAVALFKRARESYDGFFSRVAAQTTRACEVCDLKTLYQLATQGGLGEIIHENQLKEIKGPLTQDLQLLANTNSTLEITEAKLKNMSVSDPNYAATLGQVQGLKRDVDRLKKALNLPDPQGQDSFKTVLSGYKCDIR